MREPLDKRELAYRHDEADRHAIALRLRAQGESLVKKPSSGSNKPSGRGKPSTRQGSGKGTLKIGVRKGGVAASLDIAAVLRDRLNHELDLQKVPALSRPSYLAMMTGRAAPSCRRWLDPQDPGMPDLQSFASLCLQFEADANYFLGFTNIRFSTSVTRSSMSPSAPVEAESEPSRWLEVVSRSLADTPSMCATVIMRGDEMAPKINNGDAVFINEHITELQGNGTYYIEFQGRRLFRNIEDRLSEGLVLSCENPKYKQTILQPTSKSVLKVLGRVTRSVTVTQF